MSGSLDVASGPPGTDGGGSNASQPARVVLDLVTH